MFVDQCCGCNVPERVLQDGMYSVSFFTLPGDLLAITVTIRRMPLMYVFVSIILISFRDDHKMLFVLPACP